MILKTLLPFTFLHGTTSSPVDIPIVNLQDDSNLPLHLKESAKTGFFFLTNHGLDTSFIDSTGKQICQQAEVQQWAAELEELETSAFVKYGPPYFETLEGIYSKNETTPSSPRKADAKEVLRVERFRSAPNHEDPKINQLHNYYEQAYQVGTNLSRLIQTHVLENYDTTLSTTDPKENFSTSLRLNHYLETTPGDTGCGVHSDLGFVTLLHADTVGGLEIFVDGQWVRVTEVPEGALMVHIGDTVERQSNGAYKSVVHRVISNGRERYSAAFFVAPTRDTSLDCLPQFTSHQQCKHKSISFGDYIQERLAAIVPWSDQDSWNTNIMKQR